MKKIFTYLLIIVSSLHGSRLPPVGAQIVPDTTLLNNSQVQVNGETIEITGGDLNGAYLFHSFEEFSLPAGNTAYFNNGLTIDTIFSRVTGNSTSTIDGLIQANGTANLFLINPNGIVFGANARLNIGGSFLASTADSLIWDNGMVWSASNANPAPLLNINVPIGLQMGANPGDIVVEGQRLEREIPTDIQSPQQLQEAIALQQGIFQNSNGLGVEPGKTFALLGGNITFNGGLVKAREGRIELGSLQGEGLVGLTFNSLDANGGLTLDYNDDNISGFGQIQFDQAVAIASGERGGDIQIVGERFLVTNGSQIIAGTLGSQAGGNVNIRASDSVELLGNSPVQQNSNLLGAGTYGSGDSGNVTVETSRLTIQDGSAVGSGSFAEGNGGEVIIHASDSVELQGTSPNGNSISVIAAIAQSTGNAGNITLETDLLTIRDGAQVAVSTINSGQAGNIIIRAREKVEAIGQSFTGEVPSALVAETNGSGNAGNLIVETGQLIVKDGAAVAAGTLADGNGGEVIVRASEFVDISGMAPNEQQGSFVGAIAQGTGNAGNVTIETGQLILRDGGQLGVSTETVGNAGNVTLRATEKIEAIGTSTNGKIPSVIAAQTNGSGNAGNITVDTGQFIVRDGAQVAVNALGSGQAGNLTIRAAQNVQIIGSSINSQIPSGLAADTNGTGNAGNITIETREFIIRDGAQVTLETRNQGQAGTLFIRATDRVEVSDPPLLSMEQLPLPLLELLETFNRQNQTNLTAIQVPTIRAETLGSGNAGNVEIETNELVVRDGAGIFVGTFSDGQGGNLTINASESVEVSGASSNPLSVQGLGAATFAAGDAGNLTVNTARLIIRDGGKVVVGALQDGDAGTLNINASELVQVSGVGADGQEVSELSAGTRGTGNAGNVIMNTQQLLVDDGAIVNVSGLGEGNPGSIEVSAKEIVLQDRGSLTATSATGRGGNIRLQAPDLQLRDRGKISASGSETGNITLDGNINLNTEILVLLEGSEIITNAADPRGGSNIAISSIDGSNLVVFESPDSVINARGELQIDTEVDITQGEILEVDFTDVTQLISRGCEAIAEGSQFTVTGRGGLSSNPADLMSPPRSMLQWSDRETLMFSEGNSHYEAVQLPDMDGDLIENDFMGSRIIEATGAIVTDDGKVQLVANADNLNSRTSSSLPGHPTCQKIERLSQ